MSLREQQIDGPRLSKSEAFLFHSINTLIVGALSYYWWQPLFGVPYEWRTVIAFASAAFFFVPLFGYIEAGYAGAQEWFGAYTGESYSSGIYCLTKPPFPLILFALWLLFPSLHKKFFWTMGPRVSVQDKIMRVTSQFFSREGKQGGVRMIAESVLVFKMENVAHYLIQTTNDTNQAPLLEAISSVYVASIKSSTLSSYSTHDIFRGEYQKDQVALMAMLMEQFELIKNYGLSLANSPVVKVVIENQKIQHAFDQAAASPILDDSAEKMAHRFNAFMKKNPGMDEAVAWALLRSSGGEEGGPNIDIVRLKT